MVISNYESRSQSVQRRFSATDLGCSNLHTSRKDSSGLTLGWIMGDEFLVLGKYYTMRMFLYAWCIEAQGTHLFR